MQRLIIVGSSSYQQESLEKTILAVMQATRKFPHYFQEHTVAVITQFPLRSTLRSTDYAERIAKRSAVLGASDVKYVPRALVKGLVLAGLVVRFAKFPSEKEAEGSKQNLLKRLNRTLTMSSRRTSGFGEINAH